MEEASAGLVLEGQGKRGKLADYNLEVAGYSSLVEGNSAYFVGSTVLSILSTRTVDIPAVEPRLQFLAYGSGNTGSKHSNSMTRWK